MQFDNLDLFLEPATLTLPIGSETYEIPEVDGETFLRIVALQKREEPMRDDEVFPLALGQKLYDQLKKRLTGTQLSVVGVTAFLWQLGLHDAAAEHWRSGGKAKVPDGTQTETPPTTLTAEANTTRRRASSSGTSTRKRSSGSAKAPRSRGRSSSPAGT